MGLGAEYQATLAALTAYVEALQRVSKDSTGGRCRVLSR
jgi:hypothetical protein